MSLLTNSFSVAVSGRVPNCSTYRLTSCALRSAVTTIRWLSERPRRASPPTNSAKPATMKWTSGSRTILRQRPATFFLLQRSGPVGLAGGLAPGHPYFPVGFHDLQARLGAQKPDERGWIARGVDTTDRLASQLRIIDHQPPNAVAIELLRHLRKRSFFEDQTPLDPCSRCVDIRVARRTGGLRSHRHLFSGGKQLRRAQPGGRSGSSRHRQLQLCACRKDSDSAFDDGDHQAIALAVDVEFRTHRAHRRRITADDEGPPRVLCNVEQRLPLHEIDSPNGVGEAHMDRRARIQVDNGIIPKSDRALLADARGVRIRVA